MSDLLKKAKIQAAIDAGCFVEFDGTHYDARLKYPLGMVWAGRGKTPAEALERACDWGGWTPDPSILSGGLTEEETRILSNAIAFLAGERCTFTADGLRALRALLTRLQQRGG